MDDATPALHVADFFVQPGHRRRGIGKALMLEVRRIGRSIGASRLFWTVWRRNEDSVRFYQALGARTDDEIMLMEWQIG
jgi:GNAT superfamily N-acetyltransferase